MAEISMGMPGIRAVSLEEEHIDGLVSLMNKAGWYYYDHHELKRYLKTCQDCFTLLKDGRVIGSIFTTNYGNQVWIGNIIVDEKLRGMGLATKLFKGVIDYICNKRNVDIFRLGSVPLAIGVYKKVGFQAEGFTTAQEAELPIDIEYETIDLGENIRVERMRADDLKAIARIDELYFKSNRLKLLRTLYNDSIKESSFCLKDKEEIVGFIMIRKISDSKEEGYFAEGPDHVYRLGPSCVMPKYGIDGFKALFQEMIQSVNKAVTKNGGASKIYIVFPKNAHKEEVYKDTKYLAQAMGMAQDMDLDKVFDRHDHIFGAEKLDKNKAQWDYLKRLGFRQEYFEQIMSYSPNEPLCTHWAGRKAEITRANPEGIYASATPGDKA